MSRLVETVVEKGEAAIEAASDFGMLPLPCPPLRERGKSRQVVVANQLFQQQVRERGGRLADDEARMTSALEEHDRTPEPPRDHRQERAGKPGADDGDVEVGVHRESSKFKVQSSREGQRSKLKH